jgi:uncharacterized protein (DUF2267 family)
LDVFSNAVQKSYLWLKELKEMMEWEDTHRAYLALRSVLHALRDRLTAGEAVDLGSQLPMLIRGFYYDGWKPAGKPVKERHIEEFLAHIQKDFKNEKVDAKKIAEGVFRLLSTKISEGEIEDIKGNLPEGVRELWP